MDNADLPKFKDPKFYNDPEQYDDFLRYVFTSHPTAATVTSSRPFHHFRWHCQHCFFPASSPAQFKAHTADCPGGKDNISVLCGHCGHIYTTREQLHIHANRYGFHTQHSHIQNYTTRHHWPRPSPSVLVADTTLSTSTAPQTPTQTQTHTTATTASDTASSSVTSLSSTTHDDLPDLSLDSDLSTSLLDDTSTSLDLTLTDLDEILAAEPFASSTPSLNSTTHTPHAFHPFADNTTSHTSHRFQPYTTSTNTSSSLSYRHTTPHSAPSPTPSTSSVSASPSFNTYNTLLIQLFAIHSLTSVTDTSARFPPSIQAMLLTLSQSPFYPPNLPPPDQITVSEFSNAILGQLFQHFHTPPQ